jgi:hypothetical protein
MLDTWHLDETPATVECLYHLADTADEAARGPAGPFPLDDQAHSYSVAINNGTEQLDPPPGGYFPTQITGTVGPCYDSSTLTPAETSAIAQGARTTLRTTLRDYRTQGIIAGASVTLLKRVLPSAQWFNSYTTTTNGSGVASVIAAPTGATEYKWVYNGSGTHLATTSIAHTVSVGQKVSIGTRSAKAPRGRTITIFGSVTPVVSGHRVSLQQLISGKWRTIKSATIAYHSMPNDTYERGDLITFTKTLKGHYTYRVVSGATKINSSGVSAIARIAVS